MRYPQDFECAHGYEWVPARARHYVPVALRACSTGLGVFAQEDIPKGTVIFTDGGRVIHSPMQVPAPFDAHFNLIDEGVFLAPRDHADLEMVWYVNHHCRSNVRRLGGLVYDARRDIVAGEQLTLDYSAFLAGIDIDWTMACACGAATCRKLITRDDWHDLDLSRALWPEFLPFMQAHVRHKHGTKVEGVSSL